MAPLRRYYSWSVGASKVCAASGLSRVGGRESLLSHKQPSPRTTPEHHVFLLILSRANLQTSHRLRPATQRGSAGLLIAGMRSPSSSFLAVISTSLLQLPSLSLRRPCRAWRPCCERWFASTATPLSHNSNTPPTPVLPFRFETGVGLFAKRTPRPFPPPFHSPPSVSFSDPLSTHHQSRDRRAFVNGELIRGKTNGDDAIYASDYFIGTNDGVGAWATRPRGHAGYFTHAGQLPKPFAVSLIFLRICCGTG